MTHPLPVSTQTYTLNPNTTCSSYDSPLASEHTDELVGDTLVLPKQVADLPAADVDVTYC